MNDLKKFARTLCQLRIQRGEKQEQVASAVGITTVSLSRYENGQRMPKMDILSRLAQHYGVTVDYIVGLCNEEQEDYIASEEKHLLHLFRNLTDEGKAEAFKYLLLLQHEYTEEKEKNHA